MSIKLPADFSRYDLSNPALHEAGFDSYLTGWIFYQLSTPSLLKSITNKINLSMSYYHIDLQSQADAINPHTLVFYI